jgi:hypothetical protein
MGIYRELRCDSLHSQLPRILFMELFPIFSPN